MSVPAKKKATYEDLLKIPDHLVGEIIAGELVATPRPSPRHARATSALEIKVGGPYGLGEGGGPGGWWILFEPELKLGEHIIVPDLAGWRKEKLPRLPEDNWFSLAPDWVCEVLSPATIRLDRTKKLPIYAEYEVQHLWMVDPIAKTLEVFRLEAKSWLLLSAHGEGDKIRAEPFPLAEIDLAVLWV